MGFYTNFEEICTQRHTSVSAVLLKCGLTKSLGTGWKKGVSPSGDNIIKIAQYLNVSTDYLLMDKATVDSLSPIEQELINSFRKLSPNEQQRIIGRCEEMISSKDNAMPEIIDIAARSKKGNIPKTSTDEF